jgi:hypothetical protein
MLPLIKEAQKNKMCVLVMNPNLNRDSKGVSEKIFGLKYFR